MPRKIEISHKSVIFIITFILFIWFVYQVRDILLMVFISLILTSALNPAVDKLEKLKVPRAIGIFLVYLVLWGAVGGLFAAIAPGLIDQTRRLINLLPQALGQVEFFTAHQQEIGEQILTRIGSLPENLLKLTFGVFGNILNVLTTLVISFYLLLERKNLDKYLVFLVGRDHQTLIAKTINRLEQRLGQWVRGELILMFAVGFLTYLGLLLLGIDIALPLAILAGILEIIPNVGPIVSAIPSILVALTIHPLIALATVALYFLVQALENNLLVPKIMQRAVGVNPLVSILALMIGFKLYGPLGAVLSLPLLILIHTLGLNLTSLKRWENLGNE